MALFGTEDLDSGMYTVNKLSSEDGLRELALMIKGCSHTLDIRERNLTPKIWDNSEIIDALSHAMEKEDFRLRLAFHRNDDKYKALETLLSTNPNLKKFLEENRQKIESESLKLLHWSEGFMGPHNVIGDKDYCVVVEIHEPSSERENRDKDTCAMANFMYFDSYEIKKYHDLYECSIGKEKGQENIYGLPDVMTEYTPKDIELKLTC